MKICESKTPGTLWATPGLLRDCFISYSDNKMGNIKVDISDHGTWRKHLTMQ